MKIKVFLFLIILPNYLIAADSSNVLSVDRTFFFELIMYISALLILNKFLFQPLLQLKEDRDIESSVRLERADSMSEQAKNLEAQYIDKINEFKVDIDKTSFEKINNAKIAADELVKAAKNKSINEIEESKKDLSNAQILEKIKILSVSDIKDGNDEISLKIKEVSKIIKERIN